MDRIKRAISHLPHIGMRKLKSILAVFIGFLVWQGIRLFVPGLEFHPLFIYVYGIIEIRDTSEKTVSFGMRRIRATFTALIIGLPLLFLQSYLKTLSGTEWVHIVIDMSIILIGALITLCVAELVGCVNFCGLAAAIFIILVVSHADDQPIIYAVLRAAQTIIGVFIAWLVNVKLFPYPRLKSDINL